MNQGFTSGMRGELLDELLDARMQHMRWVGEIMSNENPVVEQDHTQCQFGKWMLRVKGLLGHMTEFQQLEQPHQKLHQRYRELLESTGQDQLKQEIKSCSNQLIDAIDALEKQINRLK